MDTQWEYPAALMCISLVTNEVEPLVMFIISFYILGTGHKPQNRKIQQDLNILHGWVSKPPIQPGLMMESRLDLCYRS